MPVQIRAEICGVELPLPPQVRVHLSRIVQESVWNAVRHADATEIRLEVSYGIEYLVRIRIGDNGRGFDMKLVSAPSEHWGLMTMRERAQKLGAEFKLNTSSGQGTEIEVTVPMFTEDGD
jgi:two-component system NarL family sensor kinase